MWKVYYVTWKGAPDHFWICANDYEDAYRIASTIQGVESIERIEEELGHGRSLIREVK